MKALFIIFGVLFGLILLVMAYGLTLPQDHVVTRKAVYNQSPEALWKTITNIRGFPLWRSDVKEVAEMTPKEGKPMWKEIGKHGEIPFEALESNPPRRLVTKIADSKLPFGGSWTYEIAPSNGETELKITEKGEVYNPLFRFVSKHITGHTATIDAYLKELGKKFGEDVTIQ